MSESEIVEPTHAELIKEVVNGLVDEAVDTATKKKAAKTTNCRGKKKATKTAHAEVKARPKHVKAEELVYDDRGAEYADIMNPHHYLVRKEPNLSKYTKAQKKEYFAPVIDALRVLYPNADDDELLKRAERARLDFIKRQKPPRAKPDAAALERAKEEREFRKKHPMAIRSENPELNKRLADFKGKKYDERSYHNWVGKTPRTLKDEKGSPAASYFDKTFAEMTGTLGLIPRYRKELATKKTAEIAYPKSKGYRVEAYDMDEDELTPENVLIYDKNDRLVAANGYEVLSSNPAHQLTRLKEMDYYDKYPTKRSRQDKKYADLFAVLTNIENITLDGSILGRKLIIETHALLTASSKRSLLQDITLAPITFRILKSAKGIIFSTNFCFSMTQILKIVSSFLSLANHPINSYILKRVTYFLRLYSPSNGIWIDLSPSFSALSK